MQISVLPLGELGANCYVVADEAANVCAVIDPGGDGEQLAARLADAGLSVRYIFLTHGHYDHVGGARALHDATGAPVYLNPIDRALPAELSRHLFFTDSYRDGDALCMGALTFRVLGTPGHSAGSVCLFAGENVYPGSVLFTGDTLFQGSCGRIDFPGGSYVQMLNSLWRLYQLHGDFPVYPGHGPATTLNAERRSNHYMRISIPKFAEDPYAYLLDEDEA